MLNIERWLGAALGLAVVWLAPRTVQAGIGACGDVHVEAEAQCEVVAPGLECEAMCEPVSVQAVCAARLAAECRGGCDELPSVDCSAQCEADCSADCDVDPGKFDCQAACEADCSGRCEGECEASEDQASCEGSCKGSCSASCDSHCDVELPEADCEAKCEASCQGSCEVDPNLDCQIDCQAKGQAKCEVDVQGGCEAECKGKEGALFCDGQYVDHGGNLEECIDSLKAALNAHVKASASGEAECAGGSCSAEGRAKVSSDCSVGAPGVHRRATPAVLLAAGWVLAFGVWRRRPRRPTGG